MKVQGRKVSIRKSAKKTHSGTSKIWIQLIPSRCFYFCKKKKMGLLLRRKYDFYGWPAVYLLDGISIMDYAWLDAMVRRLQHVMSLNAHFKLDDKTGKKKNKKQKALYTIYIIRSINNGRERGGGEPFPILLDKSTLGRIYQTGIKRRHPTS